MSRINAILALKVWDSWVEGVYEIRKVVVDHFPNHFRESYEDRPWLDVVSFRSISKKDNANLNARFLFFLRLMCGCSL